ncbi:MAG: RNA polymerase sigma factor RpoH [Rhodospirillales bacterium]|nr:RNA polymerase sigma factor RpoH [Rhodospirillales bacterium]
MTSMTFPVVPADGGLARYFRDIWKFPILEEQEEYMLAQRWRQHEDVDAAHKLVTSHLRLVAKIAMKYRGYGLPVADLISEGNIGLMKAVKKFEPERGFRLSTYAMWWIRASITEYILKSWSMVKMGTVAAQKKLFFSLRGLKSRLNILDSGELSGEQAKAISKQLRLPEQEIIDMNRRLSQRDASLNAPISDDNTMEFQDTLVDETPNVEIRLGEREELAQRSGALKEALARLPERERHIFVERRLKDDPQSLEELGKAYGISRERVRQLEVRAFEKVRKTILAAAA